MDPQTWLKYMESEGLAKLDSINHVQIPYPHYPYQNSLHVTKGTRINHDIHTYLIELQFLKQDNTTVAISPGNREREACVVSSSKLDDIIKFLTGHKDWAHKQPGGFSLTSNSRGTHNPLPQKANKYYNPIEVDELFAAIPSPISPGSQLSFAEGLRKLIELITEVKQTEQRTDYVARPKQTQAYKPKETKNQVAQQKQQNQSSNTSSNKTTENSSSTSLPTPTDSATINMEDLFRNLPVFPTDYKDKIRDSNRDRRIKNVDLPYQKNKDTLCMETIYIAIEEVNFKNIELGKKMRYNANDTIFSSSHRTVGGKGVDQKLIFKFYLPGNYKGKKQEF